MSKIAEKLKAFGLWEKLVTDSLDDYDYIDNLVATTETDIDVDELFQEELH